MPPGLSGNGHWHVGRPCDGGHAAAALLQEMLGGRAGTADVVRIHGGQVGCLRHAPHEDHWYVRLQHRDHHGIQVVCRGQHDAINVSGAQEISLEPWPTGNQSEEVSAASEVSSGPMCQSREEGLTKDTLVVVADHESDRASAIRDQ